MTKVGLHWYGRLHRYRVLWYVYRYISRMGYMGCIRDVSVYPSIGKICRNTVPLVYPGARVYREASATHDQRFEWSLGIRHPGCPPSIDRAPRLPSPAALKCEHHLSRLSSSDVSTLCEPKVDIRIMASASSKDVAGVRVANEQTTIKFNNKQYTSRKAARDDHTKLSSRAKGTSVWHRARDGGFYGHLWPPSTRCIACY
jgi:hypothetical protein